MPSLALPLQPPLSGRYTARVGVYQTSTSKNARLVEVENLQPSETDLQL